MFFIFDQILVGKNPPTNHESQWTDYSKAARDSYDSPCHRGFPHSAPKSHLEITAKTKRVYLWPRLSSLDIIGGPFWLPSVLEWPENALPPAENCEFNETIKKVLQLKNIWGGVENYYDLKIIMAWRSLWFQKKLGTKRPHGDFNAKYVSTSPTTNIDFTAYWMLLLEPLIPLVYHGNI